MIGIIGAMEVEVSILKEKMQDVEIIKKASMEFNKGKMHDKDIVVVRSGIGKVNAAVCAQVLADEFKVDAIINTGIAGSLKNEINIGDIVLSEDALQHDMDATGFGYEAGVIPQMDESVFKGDKNLIEKAKNVCEKDISEINVFVGRVVSGDQFIDSQEVKDSLISKFNGYCAEMEGAAIAQTAYLNNIPFLIVRAISDKADNSANMDYETFEQMAVANSVKLIEGMVKLI